MQTAEIRRRFLGHFERAGHTLVPSASLLLDDPNLLFVNAGMVPFKPYFLGQQKPPYRTAASVQKCVRTLDIEEVGKTSRHGSFFQMNGNFSFGDSYFKRGAIELAWDLSTRSQADGGFGLDPSRLWATVYLDDDEALEMWKSVTGLPEERIVRRGLADNYWSMGVPGPGGPCSEIYYDRGTQYGPEGGPEVDEDRYLEFWNLVFMQDELSAVRSKTDFDIRGRLPSTNIDTGMGLERIASILQGVDNLYEIDEVAPVLLRAAELAGVRYGKDHDDDVRLRVVADHVRTALMLIGDGVTPGNEGRGYVLRRILRRSVRAMRLLGVDTTTLPELLPLSRDVMSASYPELARDFGRISALAYAEEESFRSTLRAGTAIFDTAVRDARSRNEKALSGERAFALHDTYGFPIDITLEMAQEQGLQVDSDGFRRLMQAQRDRAKADARAKKTGHADVSAYSGVAAGLGRAVQFTGYDEVSSEGVVAGLVVGGEPAGAAGEGAEVEVVLDRTPFYAEGGGQLADHGRITLAGGALVEVLDVQKPLDGLVVHHARVLSGELRTGEAVLSEVDVERRKAISRAHTATHLVHAAFREALGETATQAGSENRPGSFRFDFSAAAVPPSALADVEARVNALLAEDLPVHAELMSQQEAVRTGALALFGEKYGDEVRVVSVGDYSRELCGGTHAQRSGQLGLITLLGEASIGAGVRRVEALVGGDAHAFLAREHVLVQALTGMLKVRREELPERVSALVSQLRDAEKQIAGMRSQALLASAAGLVAGARDVFGVAVVTHRAPDGTSADDVRRLVLDVRGRFPAERPVAVAIAAKAGQRPVVVAAVNETARSWGVKAGDLVKEAATILGGGGGGKDDVAQGGGQDPARIPDALAALEHVVGRRVTGG